MMPPSLRVSLEHAVFHMMILFVMLGHWFGLIWYLSFMHNLERESEADLRQRILALGGDLNATLSNVTFAEALLGTQYDAKGLSTDEFALGEWYWIISKYATDENGNRVMTWHIRWICSLYWALAVMTNLKGLTAHEARDCFRWKPDVIDPFGERLYTIMVFICGAVFYSFIYGNIGQFLESMYASGQRYRKRMDEINEFVRFHGLPPSLTHKIRSYVEFAYSVTKGINVESISQQLPAHLQLEVHLHLNKKMVEQVKIFQGCPRDFFKALVMRLQPCICVAGDHVFKYGEKGDRMYFVKRGMAEVLDRLGNGIHSFKEGDYFGEIALLSDSPRTADVRAVTDCMMLSLSLIDFEAVLKLFPNARHRIEAAAQERFRALLKSDTATLRMRSNSGSKMNNPSPLGPSLLTRRENSMRRLSHDGGDSSTRRSHNEDASSVARTSSTRNSCAEGLAAFNRQCGPARRQMRDSHEEMPITAARSCPGLGTSPRGPAPSSPALPSRSLMGAIFGKNNGDSSETARRSGFRRRHSVHSSEDVAADGEHMDSFARLALRRKSDPGVGNVPHAGTSQGSPLNPNSDGRDSSPGEMRREGSHHGRINPESPDFLAAAASNNTSRFDRHMCNTSAEQGSWSLSPSFIKDAGLQRDSSPLGQRPQASSGDCRRTSETETSCERRSSEGVGTLVQHAKSAISEARLLSGNPNASLSPADSGSPKAGSSPKPDDEDRSQRVGFRERSGSFFMLADPEDPRSLAIINRITDGSKGKDKASAEMLIPDSSTTRALNATSGPPAVADPSLAYTINEALEAQLKRLRDDVSTGFERIDRRIERQLQIMQEQHEAILREQEDILTRAIERLHHRNGDTFGLKH